MSKFEWFLDKCFLVLLVVVSVSLFIAVAKLEIAKDEKVMEEGFRSLERIEEKRIESIVNS